MTFALLVAPDNPVRMRSAYLLMYSWGSNALLCVVAPKHHVCLNDRVRLSNDASCELCRWLKAVDQRSSLVTRCGRSVRRQYLISPGGPAHVEMCSPAGRHSLYSITMPLEFSTLRQDQASTPRQICGQGGRSPSSTDSNRRYPRLTPLPSSDDYTMFGLARAGHMP